MGASAFARVGQDFQIGASRFGDGFWMTRVDSGEIHEIAAHAEGARAGLDKAFRGLQCDAAGGNELEMRKGREQRFQVARAADSRAGKDFYVVGAGIPRGDGLSGRELAGA